VSGILAPGDSEQLVAAAYVHDVGYVPTVKDSGLHALDGARHLRSLGYERLARWSRTIPARASRRRHVASWLSSWRSRRRSQRSQTR
jgi:hypothetical protein